MFKHEEKKCPCCGVIFECKADDITRCQCYGIKLSVEEEAFINQIYDDCLCRNCLLQLKQRYHLFVVQKIFYG